MNAGRLVLVGAALLVALSLVGCGGKSVEGKWIITQSSDMNEVGTNVLFTEDGWMDYGGERYQYEQTNETTLELKGMLSQAVQLEWRDDGTFSFNGLTLAPPDSKEAKDALATKAQIEEQKRAEEEAQRKAEEVARTKQECDERLGMAYISGVKTAWSGAGGTSGMQSYYYVAYEQVTKDLKRTMFGTLPDGWQDDVNKQLRQSASTLTTYDALVSFLQDTKGTTGEPLLPSSDYTCPAGGEITMEWVDGGQYEGTHEPRIYCSIHSPKE